MGRIPRQRLGHGVFHVYNRANDQRWIFETAQDKNKFLSAKSFCFDEVDPLIDKRNCYFWNEMGESDVDRQKVYRDYLLDEWERGEDATLFHGSEKAIGDKAFLTVWILRRAV